jgi:hypothetical protein
MVYKGYPNVAPHEVETAPNTDSSVTSEPVPGIALSGKTFDEVRHLAGTHWDTMSLTIFDLDMLDLRQFGAVVEFKHPTPDVGSTILFMVISLGDCFCSADEPEYCSAND